MTVEFNDDMLAELYRMVQWWCHDQSNTFHFIKEAIERRYPELAELNRLEFDFASNQARLVDRPRRKEENHIPRGC